MPAERAYELVFAGTAQGMTAQKKKADGTYETLKASYDSDKQCTTVILPMQDIESEITVVTYNTALADNHQVERIFKFCIADCRMRQIIQRLADPVCISVRINHIVP